MDTHFGAGAHCVLKSGLHESDGVGEGFSATSKSEREGEDVATQLLLESHSGWDNRQYDAFAREAIHWQ